MICRRRYKGITEPRLPEAEEVEVLEVEAAEVEDEPADVAVRGTDTEGTTMNTTIDLQTHYQIQ